MRNILLALLASGTAWAFFAETAPAQYPSGNYTRDRAYRHFLQSRSPYKAYSSLSQRYDWDYETPLESGHFYHVTPYRHESMSYRGHELYETPAYVGGNVERRPPPPVVVAPYPPPPLPYYRRW